MLVLVRVLVVRVVAGGSWCELVLAGAGAGSGGSWW